jgi:AhpD family alkylhydroperoxidase
MEARMNMAEIQPEAYKTLFALEKSLQNISLNAIEKELIKVRASQINGCAFCLNMHTKDARKIGETEQRIYLLNAWKETNLFNERERTILAITEEVTLISKAGLTDKTYEEALKLFSKVEIGQIIMCIVAINAWNRIAIATHLQPED